MFIRGSFLIRSHKVCQWFFWWSFIEINFDSIFADCAVWRQRWTISEVLTNSNAKRKETNGIFDIKNVSASNEMSCWNFLVVVHKVESKVVSSMIRGNTLPLTCSTTWNLLYIVWSWRPNLTTFLSNYEKMPKGNSHFLIFAAWTRKYCEPAAFLH